jgi:hypothetical protein
MPHLPLDPVDPERPDLTVVGVGARDDQVELLREPDDRVRDDAVAAVVDEGDHGYTFS